MTVTETALWWARVRAAGPQQVPAGTSAAHGMHRLLEPDTAAVWLLPDLPDGARPDVLEELGLRGAVCERPNETAQVLAACLRCCWIDPGGPIWPGSPATTGQVLAMFRTITLREDELSESAFKGALRRLSSAGWALWDEASQKVRMGPRATSWTAPQMSALRELWRSMPDPGSLPNGTAEE